MADDKNKGSGLDARQITVIVLIVLALIFILENSKHVDVRFLAPSASVPVWVALLVAVTIGVVIGWFAARRKPKD